MRVSFETGSWKFFPGIAWRSSRFYKTANDF